MSAGTPLTRGYPVSAAVAVAQLVEPRVVVPVVGGSSPLRHLSRRPRSSAEERRTSNPRAEVRLLPGPLGSACKLATPFLTRRRVQGVGPVTPVRVTRPSHTALRRLRTAA